MSRFLSRFRFTWFQWFDGASLVMMGLGAVLLVVAIGVGAI